MIFKINLKKSGKQLYDRGRGSRCCGLVFVCFGQGGWSEITYGLKRQPEAHSIC